jgi:hypothetical protein
MLLSGMVVNIPLYDGLVTLEGRVAVATLNDSSLWYKFINLSPQRRFEFVRKSKFCFVYNHSPGVMHAQRSLANSVTNVVIRYCMELRIIKQLSITLLRVVL